MSLTQQLETLSWVKMKEREYSLHFSSIYAAGGARNFFAGMSVDFEIKNDMYLDDGKIFFGADDLRVARQLFLDAGGSLGAFARALTDDFLKSASRYESFLKILTGTSIESLSHEGVENYYNDFITGTCDLVPYSFLISVILDDVAQSHLVGKFAGHTPDPALAYQALMISDKTNDTILEHRSRLNLASLIGQDSRAFNAALNKHLAQYSWISCYSPMSEPLGRESFVASLGELSNRETNRKAAHHSSDRSLLDILDSDDRLLVDVMIENIWIRTYRREIMSRGNYLTLSLYKRVSEITGIPYADLRFVSAWELAGLLAGKTVELSVEKRRLKSAVGKVQGRSIVFDEDILPYIDKHQTVVTSDSLVGTPAFKGRVAGRVRVIRRREEMPLFIAGEILVAPTVATWMTPVVEKCTGIVTDAGGILSHTAIVARELKKPCIIGTQNATKVLKDGDMVEVDADKGIIRVINS